MLQFLIIKPWVVWALYYYGKWKIVEVIISYLPVPVNLALPLPKDSGICPSPTILT